jgi:hypothetical protein
MPEIEDAVAARRAEEPRTIHHVGFPFKDRLQKQGVFSRVVLEVGVLDDQHVACGLAKATRHRRAFALICFL